MALFFCWSLRSATTVADIEESRLCIVVGDLLRIVKPFGKVVIAANLPGVRLPQACAPL